MLFAKRILENARAITSATQKRPPRGIVQVRLGETKQRHPIACVPQPNESWRMLAQSPQPPKNALLAALSKFGLAQITSWQQVLLVRPPAPSLLIPTQDLRVSHP
jgi:hypothetical protein